MNAVVPPRRRWTISLRMLLLLVLAVGAPLGWWVRRAQLQRRASAAIHAARGSVDYADEIAERWAGAVVTTSAGRVVRTSANTAAFEEPIWRTWLKTNLGPDYVDDVVWADAPGPSPPRPFDPSVLADLPRLATLKLTLPAAGGDAGLRSLAGLRDLRILWLREEGIGDLGLSYLAALTALEDLRIARPGATMTDAGLRHLRGLRSLRTLEIGGPALTDAGLKHLQGLTDLRILYLNDCPHITDAGVAGLERRVPGLKITHLRREHRLAPPGER